MHCNTMRLPLLHRQTLWQDEVAIAWYLILTFDNFKWSIAVLAKLT